MAVGSYILIFVATLAAYGEARYADKCDLDASAKPSGACGTVIRHGLNETQIQEILDAQNSTDVGPRKWSRELAAEAQAWANQCESGADPCIDYRSSKISQSYVDMQNPSKDPSLTEMVKFMHSRPEFSFLIPIIDLDLSFFRFRRSLNRRSLTGDFTNMMGCGFITFKKTSQPTNHLFCLYGPEENENQSTTTSPAITE
ncbi:venom allergen 5-like isoform X2 [Venturia canescens]|uniref:venom allergen 5-like isoform X2 n=1 Tax=Venturia canescens TaxID=32260 RepID=UPI001C9BF804|nr:venom allergen 5-like isoform X2 [Venturia canescens]